jgi:hypothetical protein
VRPCPSWLAALAAALLAAGCAAPSGHPKALVIGIDGLRAEDLAQAPALSELASHGTRVDTGGAAGFAELISGAGAAEGLDGPTLFERLKASQPEAETACFPSAPVLHLEPGAPARAALDCLLLPAADAPAAERDRAAVEAAYEALGRFGGADVDLICVHLSAPGEAQPGTPEARAALAEADAHVARLLAPLERRPRRQDEDWLVVVTAGAPPQAGAVPLLVVAEGVLPGRVDLAGASPADVAPTVLAWLGVGVPKGELAGRPRLP